MNNELLSMIGFSFVGVTAILLAVCVWKRDILPAGTRVAMSFIAMGFSFVALIISSSLPVADKSEIIAIEATQDTATWSDEMTLDEYWERMAELKRANEATSTHSSSDRYKPSYTPPADIYGEVTVDSNAEKGTGYGGINE